MSDLVLGVLDQSPIPEGSSGSDALHNTIDLARHTEALGFRRYWVAEHHATPALAGPSPEVLIGPIAAATTTLRVGSGGVMLPHYSPLKVAECFSVLSGLFPGRIDLGVGRAPGTDPETMYALQRDRRQASPHDFPDQLAELLAYLNDDFPEKHPFARLAALPGRPERPEVWLLGSSSDSAVWAAEHGLGYAFADFINPFGADYASLYRSSYRAGSNGSRPRVLTAVSAICADTAEEAEYLAASWRAAFAMMRLGRLIPVPSPEKGLQILGELGIDPAVPPHRRRAVVGDPETVREGIEAVAAEYGADEALVVTITYDHEKRRRSYELIAESAGLVPRADFG